MEMERAVQHSHISFNEERNRRVIAEDEVRRVAILTENQGGNVAEQEREGRAEKNKLLSDNLALKEVNTALTRELSLSESARRAAEAAMAHGPPVVIRTESPTKDREIHLLENMSREVSSRSGAEMEEMKREMGGLSAALEKVGRERDQLERMLRSHTGISSATKQKKSLTPGPKPSDILNSSMARSPAAGKRGVCVTTPNDRVKAAEDFFSRSPGK